MSFFGHKVDVVSARAAGSGTLPLFGAAVGAGLAYAFFGQDLMSLGAGAAAGYFVYPMAQHKVSGLASSLPYPAYILPALSGAAVSYGMYGQDYVTIAGGAAVGAGAGYLLL